MWNTTIHQAGGNKLQFVFPSIIIAGAVAIVYSLRQIPKSLHSVLRLSDELDPLRPPSASGENKT